MIHETNEIDFTPVGIEDRKKEIKNKTNTVFIALTIIACEIALILILGAIVLAS